MEAGPAFAAEQTLERGDTLWGMNSALSKINVCAISRTLLPAYAVAIVTSTATGNDVAGLGAAVATGAALVTYRKLRGTPVACPIPVKE